MLTENIMTTRAENITKALGSLYDKVEEYKADRKRINKAIQKTNKEISTLLASINNEDQDVDSTPEDD